MACYYQAQKLQEAKTSTKQRQLEIDESLRQVQQQSEHLKQQLTHEQVASGKKTEGIKEGNRDLQQQVNSNIKIIGLIILSQFLIPTIMVCGSPCTPQQIQCYETSDNSIVTEYSSHFEISKVIIIIYDCGNVGWARHSCKHTQFLA